MPYYMQDKRILLKPVTLEALKILKSKYATSSYDVLISQLIENSMSSEKLEKMTHTVLLDEIKKLLDRNLKRIEATHKRLGFYEKDYFLKISDINSEISKLDFKILNEKNDIKPIEEKPSIADDNNYKNLQKLNLLKSKSIKTDDVFTATYNITLSEADYLKIFE